MIPSRTSQHNNIVALTWHNDIIVLQYDSEGDQLQRVQSVGPYNLRLSRPAVTSNHDNIYYARGGKERLTWLDSWPSQTTNGMGRSQRTDREIPRGYHDIVAEFHIISQYKKFPLFEL